MDFQRLFLFLIFSFSGILLWNGWERAQHPVQPISESVNLPVTKTAVDLDSISSEKKIIKQDESINSLAAQGQKITISTDTLKVEVNTLGGDIQKVELLKHKDTLDSNKPYILLQNNKSIYTTQTGLLGEDMPTHHSLYTTENANYVLNDGSDKLVVKLRSEKEGVTKILTFHRNSYLITTTFEIENKTQKQINPSGYFQILRDETPPEGASKLLPTYTGPAIFTEKSKFQKVEFSSIEKNKAEYPHEAKDGWIAMLQHYFVSAWIPENENQREYYAKEINKGLFAVGTIIPAGSIAPGEIKNISAELYVGPASSNLNSIAPGLGLTVDYGWLTIIATPLFWILSAIEAMVHNWGIAIILLTILIKLVFFPLSAASYKSMAKMRVVAPKLEKIKKQYSDDREKLNRAMMELYKEEKINPLGGCLPMLIQIPVFISLYWAILSSVELRHAPFFGWISDLSAADPYYILPALMGISMIIQSRLSPAPADPLQAKMMKLMPIVFSVVFFFFPAGLVLYSVINNILSISQQWFITNQLEKANKVATT